MAQPGSAPDLGPVVMKIIVVALMLVNFIAWTDYQIFLIRPEWIPYYAWGLTNMIA